MLNMNLLTETISLIIIRYFWKRIRRIRMNIDVVEVRFDKYIKSD